MPAMSQREINCRGAERKVPEKSEEEKRNRRDSPSRWRLPFFVPHRSVSQRKRGQPMNREELRDKNYAAIKRDINTSCMRSSGRDLTLPPLSSPSPPSHVVAEMKTSRVKGDRAIISRRE